MTKIYQTAIKWGRNALLAGLAALTIGGCSGQDEAITDNIVPVPRDNQKVVVHQNDRSRLHYTILTNGDRKGGYDYATEVDDIKNRDRTRRDYVDSTISFNGPVGPSVELVAPSFFSQYPGE